MSKASNLSREARERRLEIERSLAEHGLVRGPRRVLSSGRRALGRDATVAGLRSVLAESGPVFRAFGRYLSRRADLLPATDCLRFFELEDRAPRSPLQAVDARLLEELGRPRREIFPTFEEQPFESRWLDQSHHGRLAGGERVVVRVLHPGRDDLEPELDALGVLAGVLADSEIASVEHFEEVLADFRRDLTARLELRVQADALLALGRDARRSDLLVVPQVYRDLSTSGVLTVQWLPGATIDEIAALPALQSVDAEDVARRICLIWLQMALAGHHFPTQADVLELPDGRLAVTGGTFAELPDTSRVNLWNYLRATVEHFPDRAAACLLREVTKQRSDAASGELRTRVRQVVPFRDGSWSTSGESLGEYAVLHWRVLRDVGFRAGGNLDCFYQGLFWAVSSARRFAPQSDPMGEALRDFDVLSGWNQLRQMATPQQMVATLESYLGGLVELPQKIDRILSLATEEGKGFRLPAAPPRARRRLSSIAVVLSLGLAMAALVLVQEQWLRLAETVGLHAMWADRFLAAAFLALGGLLLWNIVRRREIQAGGTVSDIMRSMIRFSWAMSLFGVRQAAEMVSALGTARSPRQATAAFDAVTRAAEEQLGEGGLGDAYRAADRWQADLIDAVFGAVDPALDFSRGVASKTVLRGSLAMLRQSAAVLETAMPAGNRVMWRELRNKLEVFDSFQYVEQILGYEALENGDLCDQIEKAEDSGPYLKLWLTEGLGFAFTEAAWDRGEPRQLLRGATLEPLPEESLIPLHTGMGLSLARRVLPDLEVEDADLAAPLRRFAFLCGDNARTGFALASYEALGLIVRHLAPRLTVEIDRELARQTGGPDHRDAFWHGVGRGLYFTATQTLPGSTGRAAAKARQEAPAGAARLNALSGLAWAVTLVNFRQPEVLEGFLRDGAFDRQESGAVGEGIAAAMLLWRDAVGEEDHFEAFRRYEADERWWRMVAAPCAAALEEWSELKASSGPGAIFRVRGGG